MNFQQFLKEYNSLKSNLPCFPNHSLRSENAEYGDYLYSTNNVYYAFDCAYCQDIVYLFDSFKAVNCIDGDYVIESENCYECVDVLKGYNSTYLIYCARISDSHFCWDCADSDNLFGCVHLKHKRYCIFNRQYTKEEYEKKVKELLKRPPEENFKDLDKVTMMFPVTTTNVSHSENCDYGNHVHYSNNCYLCFDAAYDENSGYLYDSHHNKYSYDLTQTVYSENCYECTDSARLNNCFYMNHCEDMYDSGFCTDCSNSHHLFGCVGLKKKEYCILNKQYSEEEYKREIEKIMISLNQANLHQAPTAIQY